MVTEKDCEVTCNNQYMTRFYDDNRRISTKNRDDYVHIQYNELRKEYGDKIFFLLPKGFIYAKISERTGLCTKTIANILNHTHITDKLILSVKKEISSTE